MPRPHRGKQPKSGLTQSFVSAAAAASHWLILNEHGQGRPGAAVFGLILLQIARLWKAAPCFDPPSPTLSAPAPPNILLAHVAAWPRTLLSERVPVRAKRARLPFN